ncbi:hypothetical protein D7P23_09605 [Staphylococcus aureus]|nr:hypothetical protein C7Q47_10485 [Staphylococcus aureus]PZK57870.1 hypothetical protein C7Q50_11325 [Staphylococcus aureus]QHG80489.1 hypothetical protein D7B62_11790 [Staphylococcus aureus]RDE35342.1 hypothetical protein DV915_05475 [Staphylococcus aureus]RDE37099.1 hypothetical protein DV923_03895 [Staphylococcus aureus]
MEASVCQLTISCKLAGFQHSGIGFPISTDDANLGKRAQHSEIGFLISTDDASWREPNIVKSDF